MRQWLNASVVLAAFLSFNFHSAAKDIPVSPDSELGRQMLELDAVGRAFQNKPLFTKSLRDFAKKNGEACTDVDFESLQEPGIVLNRSTRVYTIVAASPTCGRSNYHARVTFRDPAHTVARRVEILIGPKEEAQYKEKAAQFIKAAQGGKVDEMLALTSPLSYSTEGKTIREFYTSEVIPQFQGVDVAWQSGSAAITDERRNVGVAFTGHVTGRKTYNFRVAMYREKGKIVLVNIEKAK